MMKGNIHSIESFGAVDGPGVRFVVFLQGCPMRCAYCHNPDTWETNKGTPMETMEIIDAFERNRSFYQGGGITATGGEPMLQTDFLIELFSECRKRAIHTCLDTSGICFCPGDAAALEKTDRLLALTDLIMLDIKHINSIKHREMTGQPNENILAFAKYLENKQLPVWIRHVAVPGITDDEESLSALGWFIGGLPNVKALDLLPYHSMGKVKYEALHLDYPLENIPDMNQETAFTKKKIILSAIQNRRANKPSN